MFGPAIRRTRDGGYQLHLDDDEREALRSLPGQLREILDVAPDEPALRRLSPPAYTGEPEHEEEYRRYMGGDLRRRQVDALEVMRATAGAEQLTEEQAQSWLSALNSLRLVIGTKLDVSEDTDSFPVDPDDPYAPDLQVYHYLSMLLDELVTALAGGLPSVEDEGGAGDDG